MKLPLKKILFLSPSVLLFVLGLIFFTKDYQNFIAYLKNIQPEIYSLESIELSLSQDRFDKLQILLLFLTSFFLLGSILFLKKASILLNNALIFFKNSKTCYVKCLRLFSTLSVFQKISISAIALLAILHKVVLMIKLPLSNDEVFSYIYFIKQDFWISAIYYPEPNNHVFFNLICNFFDLFISDAALCMRLPSLLIFTATLAFLFFFTLRNFGIQTATAALTLCAFSIGPAFYSIQGRGYMLMGFFSLLASFALIEYLKNPERKFFKHLFILSCILGMYTIPIFLFPFIAIFIYAGYVGDKRTHRSVFLASSIIGIAVLILYSPLIALNGWDALAGNRWVKAEDLGDLIQILPAATAESIDYILGTSRRGYLLLIAISFICFFLRAKNIFTKNEKSWLIFISTNLVAVILLIFLLRHFPPYRAWTYLSLFVHIFISIILSRVFIWLFKSKSIYPLGLLLLGYACLMIVQLQPDPKNISFHDELTKNAEEILKGDPAAVFIDKHDVLELALRYECIKRNQALDFDMIYPIKDKNYDYMIFYHSPSNVQSLKNYSQASFFDEAIIYKKNNP